MSDDARYCPHCKSQLEDWAGPPETGWGIILVCNNNDCCFFKGSNKTIIGLEDDSPMGCRYAEDPDNSFIPFNLLAWHG